MNKDEETYEPLSEEKFTELRSDLWSTMTLDQLVKQQELMLARMQKATQLKNTSAATIGAMLQRGYNVLTQIILDKSSQK